MAKDILIRPASPGDVKIISEITLEAFNKYSLDLGSRAYISALNEKESGILSDIKNKSVFVGELNCVPCGTIRVETVNGIGYISRFGVKLIAQARGMGGALINAAKNLAAERGLYALALHTSSKMTSLVRFYYGKGFYVHSTSKDRGYVRALMVYELASKGLDYDDILEGL